MDDLSDRRKYYFSIPEVANAIYTNIDDNIMLFAKFLFFCAVDDSLFLIIRNMLSLITTII